MFSLRFILISVFLFVFFQIEKGEGKETTSPDQVHWISGEFLYEHHLFELPGPMPTDVTLRRADTSTDESDFSIANGWVLSFGPKLKHKAQALTLKKEKDAADRLNRVSIVSSMTGKEFGFVRLQRAAGSIHLLTHTHQKWILHLNQSGDIQAIQDPNGKQWTFIYDEPGCLTEVRDPKHVGIRAEYDENGKTKSLFSLPSEKRLVSYDFQDQQTTRILEDGTSISTRHDGKNILEMGFKGSDQSLVRKTEWTWDAEGRLTQRRETDRKGNERIRKSYEYDPDGKLQKKSIHGDLTGRKNGNECFETFYEYDEQRRLISKKKSDGTYSRTFYEGNGDLPTLQIVDDGMGNYVREGFSYTPDGLVSETWTDNGNGNQGDDLSDVTERRVKKWTLSESPNSQGMPITVEEFFFEDGQDILDSLAFYSYTSQGWLHEVLVHNGDSSLRTSYSASFDLLGRPTYLLESGKGEKVMSYDDSGLLSFLIDLQSGEEFSYVYDEEGRLISVQQTTENGNLLEVQSRYDAQGRIASSIDPLGHCTEYQYDFFGRLKETKLPEVVQADGILTRPTLQADYDDFDQIATRVDAEGGRMAFRYNSRGQPTWIQHPDGTEETFIYSTAGKLVESVDRNGVLTRTSRDDFSRVVSELQLDANGEFVRETTHEYDSFRKISTQAPNHLIHSSQYDAKGRLIEERKEQGSFSARTKYEYDSSGELEYIMQWYQPDDQSYTKLSVDSTTGKQSILIEDGHQQVFRKISEQASALQSESWERLETNYHAENEWGQRVVEIEGMDSKGNTTRCLYDTHNRVVDRKHISVDGALLSHETLTYDLCGRLIRHSFISDGNESYVKWAYNSSGELILKEEQFPNMPTKFTEYEYLKGKLLKEKKSDGVKIHYEYDAVGRISHVFSTDQTVDYRYEYDELDRPILITDQTSGDILSRSYHSLGSVEEETLPSGLTMRHKYDLQGRQTELILPDQSSIRYEYDAVDLKEIQRYASDRTLAYSHRYDRYDTEGRLLQESFIFDLGSVSYQWNESGQIVSSGSPYFMESIDWNEQGLPTSITTSDVLSEFTQSYSFNDQNKLVDESASQFRESCFDANGNLLKEGETFYEYDAWNRLTHIQADRAFEISYSYDGLDRCYRQKKRVWDGAQERWGAWVRTDFLFDDHKEIGSVNEDGVVVQLRILGQGIGAEIGASVAIELDGKTYAAVQDYRGSIRELIDPLTKKAVEIYRHEAFGKEEIYNGQGKTQEKSALGNPWRCFGKRIDEHSGLIDFGKRFYSPTEKRWITPDPLGQVDGSDPYQFVKGNPLIYTDLYGAFSISTAWGHVNALLRKVQKLYTAFSDRYLENNLIHYDLAPWIESVGKTVFGELTFYLSGYYSTRPGEGVYGEEEAYKNVRFTFIHGILSQKERILMNLQLISSGHRNTKVHYIYWGTAGFAMDILQCALVRFGFLTNEAVLLADLWKRQIADLGGPGNGGVIIHYAHSIGVAETYNARFLLTPEEQAMIRVISFGSPLFLPNEGFQSLIQFVRFRDGVTLLDPIGFLRHLVFGSDYVFFFESNTWPIVDHLFEDYWESWQNTFFNDLNDFLDEVG